VKCGERGRNINASVIERRQNQECGGRGGQRPQREESERRVRDTPRQKPSRETRGGGHCHDDLLLC